MRRSPKDDPERGTPDSARPAAARRQDPMSPALIRQLARPVSRTVPWAAIVAGGTLGLLLAWIPRGLVGEADARLCLTFLRAAMLTFALGLAFLFDDPARHTTAAVPARRPVRAGLRVALAAPVAAVWWAAAVALIPAGGRPPVGAVTLEAAAVAVLALAVAAAGVRFSDEARPGARASVTLLVVAVAAQLLVPDRWSPFVTVDDDRWSAAHHQWAALLAASVLAWAAAVREPHRHHRIRLPRRAAAPRPSTH
ncbi:ABC transporter [Streptomyces sp. NPDC059785]|uniref:ABC transporter n=1 Tax=Streptomyces sp. NPDC059785 TaxID=3346945 RepID=UPI00364F65E5